MAQKNLLKNRQAIRRQGAETYLVITLLSFAATVSVTRLFLFLTGYPRLGNGELHIAHVLWGGLTLFISCLLMLTLANRWVYLLGALLAGVGVGLFIDEVGKFITQNNDYFYPSAAPIIYAFFLMTVLVLIIIRKLDHRETSDRETLYYVLEDLGEVLDHDLSIEEKEDILDKLEHVITQNRQTDIKNLALNLKQFINSEHAFLVEEDPHLWQVYYFKLLDLEKKWISRLKLKTFIFFGLLGLGTWMVFSPLLVLMKLRDPHDLTRMVTGLVNDHLVRNPSGLTWFQAKIGLEGSLGLVLILAAGLILSHKQRYGILLAYVGLIFTLTVVNLMVFYFNQFSTIALAVFQFAVLMAVISYRNRFINV